MSRPALLDKLFQAGKTLFKPALIPVDNTTIKAVNNQLAVQKATATTIGGVKITGEDGLVMQSDGSAAVDFDAMPTDKFEAMLKSIRVPIWLEANKAFYVNQATGSDTLDNGRGESESKPFKTIQACVNYVCENYNMSRYNATIYIADGVYSGSVSLPSYSTSTGTITIRSSSGTASSVTIDRVVCTKACTWSLMQLTIKHPDKTTAGWQYAINAQNSAVISLYDVIVDMTDFEKTNGDVAVLGCSNGGTINVSANWNTNICGLEVKVSETCEFSSLMRVDTGGKVLANADITMTGNHEFNPTVYVNSLSQVSFVRTSAPYPDHQPTVIANGTYTGQRYQVLRNSIVQTGGGGAELFPGDTAGTMSSGGQYA